MIYYSWDEGHGSYDSNPRQFILSFLFLLSVCLFFCLSFSVFLLLSLSFCLFLSFKASLIRICQKLIRIHTLILKAFFLFLFFPAIYWKACQFFTMHYGLVAQWQERPLHPCYVERGYTGSNLCPRVCWQIEPDQINMAVLFWYLV